MVSIPCGASVTLHTEPGKKKEHSLENLGGPPHPVTVAIRDKKDYIRVLLSSYYTTITGWRVLLKYIPPRL